MNKPNNDQETPVRFSGSSKVEATFHDPGGPSNVPVSSVARRDRYAEAVRGCTIAAGYLDSQHIAAAVMAVADSELASLRAEVERLMTLLDSRNRVVEKVKRLAQNWQSRAVSAESRERVLREGLEALADRLNFQGTTWIRSDVVADLRALLASSPAATTGEASNVSDADFEEQRRVAAEAAGLTRVGTTDDGRGIYADRPFKSPSWDEIVMRVNATPAPAPVSSGEAAEASAADWEDRLERRERVAEGWARSLALSESLHEDHK